MVGITAEVDIKTGSLWPGSMHHCGLLIFLLSLQGGLKNDLEGLLQVLVMFYAGVLTN
jgi:hypothetical protein